MSTGSPVFIEYPIDLPSSLFADANKLNSERWRTSVDCALAWCTRAKVALFYDSRRVFIPSPYIFPLLSAFDCLEK